jgi:hypothetical protein
VPVLPPGTDEPAARADDRHRTRPTKCFFSRNIAGVRPVTGPNWSSYREPITSPHSKVESRPDHGARPPTRDGRASRPGRRPSPYSTDKIFLFSKYQRRSSRYRPEPVELRRADNESVLKSRVVTEPSRTTAPVSRPAPNEPDARAGDRHRARPTLFTLLDLTKYFRKRVLFLNETCFRHVEQKR